MNWTKKISGKINYVQLVLDLIIVFIGVTLAFLFTSYQEQEKVKKQTTNLLTLFETKLDDYENLFSGFAVYLEERNQSFENRLNKNVIPNYSGVTFPSPQYPIEVIDLLNDQVYEVLDQEVYIKLSEFSNAIRRMIYTEQKLVDISEKHIQLPEHDDTLSPIYYIEQKKWAKLYLRYSKIRESTSKELVSIIGDLKKELEKYSESY
ncbi:hypothetical protein GTQ40_07155 [Flavobacteriaceae bacterium R38]|nr:hypothetical protein [Flavobacteriaceae bacterium R38]